MKETLSTGCRFRACRLVAFSIAATMSLAGCGSGNDDTVPPSSSASGTTEDTSSQDTIEFDGKPIALGDFTFLYAAHGHLTVGGRTWDFSLPKFYDDENADFHSCSLLFPLDSPEGKPTIIANFRSTFSQWDGDFFSFVVNGKYDDVILGAFDHLTGEEWQHSGPPAANVSMTYVPFNENRKVPGLDVVVTWGGEASENFSSVMSPALVSIRCFFLHQIVWLQPELLPPGGQ